MAGTLSGLERTRLHTTRPYPVHRLCRSSLVLQRFLKGAILPQTIFSQCETAEGCVSSHLFRLPPHSDVIESGPLRKRMHITPPPSAAESIVAEFVENARGRDADWEDMKAIALGLQGQGPLVPRNCTPPLWYL
jgi:hypothetical protein